MWWDLSVCTIIFYPVTLSLKFDPFFENFYLANYFWTVSARAWIFYMSIPCDKTFQWVPFLLPCDIDFNPFFENFNLGNYFWTVSARAWIFYMSIPCDKTFQWVPLFFTLWPWAWSLTHFLKTFSLLITFEQWVLEFWYFTWISLVMRSFFEVLNLLTLTFD